VSADPTRIALRTDPRNLRMTGTTAHGFIPFDVPFISEIAPGLWQGGCTNGLVLPDHIRHLVSLYPWESYTVMHELDSAVAVRMHDSTEQALEQVPVLGAWVNACRKSGPVLVQCQAGLNRSSLVTAMALMLSGITADAAIALIREKRSPACLCNPMFEEWLRNYKDAAPVSLMAPLGALWPDGPGSAIGTRTLNRLRRQQFRTVGELAACKPDDLLGLHDFGHGQLREVERVLAAAGLQLQEAKAS
jgi:protein-tyrosine phosphatase